MIEQKDKIVGVISLFFPKLKFIFLGLMQGAMRKRGSDIDIAIDDGKELDIIQLQQIRNMIDCLNLVQTVDVVDFQAVPDELKQNILKGIVWKNTLAPACETLY